MAEETTANTETTAATGAETKAAETTQATETKAVETTQATETKGAEATEAKAEETKAEETKAAETKAEPVDYAKAISEVAMPEGVTLDTELAKTGGDLFQKYNLPADAVKVFVSLYAQQQKAAAEAPVKAYAEVAAQWKAQTEKQFSKEVLAGGNAALRQVFDVKTIQVLEQIGVIVHPGFVAGMVKLAPHVQNDKVVTGNAGGGGTRDARDNFPKSNMNP